MEVVIMVVVEVLEYQIVFLDLQLPMLEVEVGQVILVQ